jgi:hypothetical protein
MSIMDSSYHRYNATVHRAAANDFDFRNRAARGSVCNGLLSCLYRYA